MTKKQRNTNIELLRLIAMFMIVVFHIVDHCVVIQLTDTDSIARLGNGLFNYPLFYKKLFILNSIMPLGKAGNAIFLIISGYFMILKGKEINIVNISKKLLLQLGFAAIMLVLASTATYYYNIRSLSNLNLVNIKIFNGMSWFVGYYFLVILIAALFLNRFLISLDKKGFITFLITLFAVVEFTWSSGVINDLANGLSTLCTGVFLYSLGAFIQKYDPFERVRTYVFFLVIGMTYVLIYISGYNNAETNIKNYFLNDKTGNLVQPFFQSISKYNDSSIVVILIGLCMFEIFRRIKVPTSRTINFLAKSTFMIYLIHDNSFFYSIWGNKDWITTLYNTPGRFVISLLKWSIATFLTGVFVYILYILAGKIFMSCRWMFLKKGDSEK
ncbi:MAG: acyltransferase family protein [Lachnospiraceae bacterium]|nr:acyltransferase family protein [Lachnospiraceae bacterium]